MKDMRDVRMDFLRFAAKGWVLAASLHEWKGNLQLHVLCELHRTLFDVSSTLPSFFILLERTQCWRNSGHSNKIFRGPLQRKRDGLSASESWNVKMVWNI